MSTYYDDLIWACQKVGDTVQGLPVWKKYALFLAGLYFLLGPDATVGLIVVLLFLLLLWMVSVLIFPDE